jgi:hypothetical protein
MGFHKQLYSGSHQYDKVAQSVLTPIPDVFQAGQWTFSPSGLPISILTGKLAADKVKKQINDKANGLALSFAC